MRTDELSRWVAIHRVARLGAARYGLLEAAFSSMEEARGTGRGGLLAAGLDERTADEVVRRRAEIDPAAELERIAEAGIHAFPRPHPGYPARLREIADPPPVLYVHGERLPQDEWSLAVVGTRRATAYGRQAAGELARGLAANSVTVVSGLARGIDTTAHRAALDAGGRTVAVLANGLATTYPPQNRCVTSSRRRAVTASSASSRRASMRRCMRSLGMVSVMILGRVMNHSMRGGAAASASFRSDQFD